MNAIKKSRRADYNFKMNFLVLVYNFFIEANQNRWISRKMLSFGGNFLFPVYTGIHHYIICYNIKRPQWEIIDNRAQEMSMEDTYGDLPWNLREIVNLEPTVVTMSWQTLDNVVDCGVFVMRHLESYMGSANGWSTGLRAERVCSLPLK
ncbi:hypothetical protein DCAR_0311819 [Daucus carota subsp. sativus]|uniref:Ubiquitin-like protease family profile domain-containing protein n=1 Tax=Daucus carota subsp. sativus TaxID=79200 RepID=A0AAF0WMV3_DAUCS|nr:hypothetical protein DCAR_0311819 [Daucus carota subsp. sativus]